MANQPTRSADTVNANEQSGGDRPGALAVLAVTSLMLVLDVTVVVVALPKIQGALQLGEALVWVINSYTLALGGLMLFGGRLGDIVGQRRVLMAGLALFGIASLVGGLANTGWLLITARTVQGVGAALAAPASLALIPANFAEGPARDKAVGVYTAVAGAGGVLGLILGGILTDALSWRWVLLINVPIIAIVLLVTPSQVRESTRRSVQLDLAGAVTATAGMVAVVYGLIRSAGKGWGDSLVLTSLAAGVVLLAIFVAVESKASEPLVPFRLLAHRVRGSGFGVMLLFPAALASMFFFLTQFLQLIQSHSALSTGLSFLPTPILLIIFSIMSAQLAPKVGAGLLAAAGLALSTLALVWLAQLSADQSYVTGLLGPLALFGIGGGLIYAPVTGAILGNVQATETGVASGVLQTVQQVGSAFGLAVLVAVAGTATNPVDGMSRAFWAGTIFTLLAIPLALLARQSRTQPATTS
jgi:EmrB/QacA subfamily drug resistance transporter